MLCSLWFGTLKISGSLIFVGQSVHCSEMEVHTYLYSGIAQKTVTIIRISDFRMLNDLSGL
jgi:hypothetical protein